MAGVAKVVGSAAVGAYAYQQANTVGLDDFMRGFSKRFGVDLGSKGSVLLPAVQEHNNARMDRIERLLMENLRTPQYLYQQHAGSWNWKLAAALAGAAVIIWGYCKYTNKTFWDLFFVTNKTLTEFKTSVTSSIKIVWEEMKRTKDEIMSRVTLLGKQQEQVIQGQEKMEQRLQDVSHDVHGVRDTADRIHEEVENLRTDQAQSMRMLEQATQGIWALGCTILNVTRHVNMPQQDSQLLEGFLQRPPGQAHEYQQPNLLGPARQTPLMTLPENAELSNGPFASHGARSSRTTCVNGNGLGALLDTSAHPPPSGLREPAMSVDMGAVHAGNAAADPTDSDATVQAQRLRSLSSAHGSGAAGTQWKLFRGKN